MRDIAIYGAGGLGKEVACLISSINSTSKLWNLIGFFDDGLEIGRDNGYGKVLGNMEVLNSWETPLSLVLAIGTPKTLKYLVEKINNPLINFPNLIAPDVLFFDKNKVELGKGNIITYRCSLSCQVKLGDFNIFNVDVHIGHDASVGNFNMLNPTVRISGNVTIGNINFFGLGSAVLQGVKVGDEVVVGAYSVIIRKTKNNVLYMGNPAIVFKF